MNSASSPQTPREWLQPVSERAPCGPSPQYDPDYLRLASLLSSGNEPQRADEFDGRAPSVPWSEIEGLCRNLLARTRDINALIWLCRARVRTVSAFGLAQGLGTLADLLERWPRDIHPHGQAGGASGSFLRTNALAALCDPDGLLGDIRCIVISGDGARLLVRDVERAFSSARADDPVRAAAIRRQLDELRIRARGDSSTVTWLLGHAACSAQRIHQWCVQHLRSDAPDLTPLLRVLRPYEPLSDPVINLAENTQAQARSLSTGRPVAARYGQDAPPHVSGA